MAVAIAIGGLSWSIPAIAQDTIGNRLLAAEKYAATSDIGEMLNGAIAEAAKNIPKNERKKFILETARNIDIPRLRSLMVNAMVQVFTVDELNLLTEFYGSPTGQSIMKKFPEYMGAVMPFMQDELKKAAEKN